MQLKRRLASMWWRLETVSQGVKPCPWCWTGCWRHHYSCVASLLQAVNADLSRSPIRGCFLQVPFHKRRCDFRASDRHNWQPGAAAATWTSTRSLSVTEVIFLLRQFKCWPRDSGWTRSGEDVHTLPLQLTISNPAVPKIQISPFLGHRCSFKLTFSWLMLARSWSTSHTKQPFYWFLLKTSGSYLRRKASAQTDIIIVIKLTQAY